MASFIFIFSLSSLLMMMLISPALSQKCSSQTFKTNKVYTNCSDLPTLNSFLHYTYNSSNSSLAIAFKATPSKPEGWVAWALNLNGTGMAGSQALVAFKSNGTLIVKKYNIISYSNLSETTKLAVDVWDVSSESDSTGAYVIFASVKVPSSLEKLNHIWQVGPSVMNGFPAKHDFAPANLAAKATLELVASTATAPAGAGNTSGNSNSTGAGHRMNSGYQVGLFVVVSSLIGSALCELRLKEMGGVCVSGKYDCGFFDFPIVFQSINFNLIL
ncbi:Cytochrome b561 and DOMON domain-containing protein At4g12980 [Euphorbia peplus]|nr:Cytochrome b561 and DOMON domain-containing protein At4g12980 [Euphorbia peplus]